jgi:hypothetical protein
MTKVVVVWLQSALEWKKRETKLKHFGQLPSSSSNLFHFLLPKLTCTTSPVFLITVRTTMTVPVSSELA